MVAGVCVELRPPQGQRGVAALEESSRGGAVLARWRTAVDIKVGRDTLLPAGEVQPVWSQMPASSRGCRGGRWEWWRRTGAAVEERRHR